MESKIDINELPIDILIAILEYSDNLNLKIINKRFLDATRLLLKNYINKIKQNLSFLEPKKIKLHSYQLMVEKTRHLSYAEINISKPLETCNNLSLKLLNKISLRKSHSRFPVLAFKYNNIILWIRNI